MASAIMLFAIVDLLFGVRERASRMAAYAPISSAADDERAREAVRYRIGLLLKPREGKAVIGGDPSGPLIEAGLLYGRLAILEERRGNSVAVKSYMAQAVNLLRAAGQDPTEEHIRDTVAKQDATRRN